ncbi:MAG: YbfB/YjiJ family MFS transporter [Desulfuromonadales bacterium]|nr:YbfB/YjiJ family MFS transporter [Desulfuromonadales bacterium]
MTAIPAQGRAALRVLLGGMLGMVVAMGIGRFAYTPILPLMQRDLGMSHTLAGWLAGLNYFGYFAGALLCTVKPQLLRSQALAAGVLLLSLATTLGMGLTDSPLWWGAMRLAAGIASAILFIVISAEVGESLLRRGYGHWFGSLYGGIGLGIVFCGLIIPQLDRAGGWSVAWTGSGLLAIVLAVLGTLLGRERSLMPAATAPAGRGGGLASISILASAYFFEGLGYIVTATFLVAIIAVTPGLATFAPYSWVAVGVAAIPSTIFWPWLARRIGSRKALLSAYLLQAAGILVSIRAGTVIEVLFAAVSFGGTFLGIVAMTLAEGRQRMELEGRRAAAFLTASFSIGQMLGPVLAGVLADLHHGFTLPLLFAAGSVMLGASLTLLDRNFHVAGRTG